MGELNLDTIIGWDVYNWSGCIPFWLNGLDVAGKRVLALGEREGGLSLFFASRGAQVICSDFGGIKGHIIEEHNAYPFHKKISYADVNVFEIPYENDSFDIVVCKSVIGGLKLNPKEAASRTLENQKLAIHEIQRVLKPGGYYLGAENMKGAAIIQYLRNRYKKGNIGWRHLSTSDLSYLLTGFTHIQLKYFGLVPGLFKWDVVNKAIHLVNKILNSILPPQSKYIAFIKCQKASKNG